MERPEPGAGTPELEPYEDGFVAWLGDLGYSPRTCEAQVALLRHLARWLAEQRVPLSGLSSEVAGRVRRCPAAGTVAACGPSVRSARCWATCAELGAVPPAAAVVPHEPVDVLLARFGGWLSRERGLAPATVSSYLYQARPFADACAGQLGVLTAARVSGLATAGCRGTAAPVGAGAGERRAGAAALHVAGGPDRRPARGVRRVVRRPGRPGRAERPQPRAGG